MVNKSLQPRAKLIGILPSEAYGQHAAWRARHKQKTSTHTHSLASQPPPPAISKNRGKVKHQARPLSTTGHAPYGDCLSNSRKRDEKNLKPVRGEREKNRAGFWGLTKGSQSFPTTPKTLNMLRGMTIGACDFHDGPAARAVTFACCENSPDRVNSV